LITIPTIPISIPINEGHGDRVILMMRLRNSALDPHDPHENVKTQEKRSRGVGLKPSRQDQREDGDRGDRVPLFGANPLRPRVVDSIPMVSLDGDRVGIVRIGGAQ